MVEIREQQGDQHPSYHSAGPYGRSIVNRSRFSATALRVLERLLASGLVEPVPQFGTRLAMSRVTHLCASGQLVRIGGDGRSPCSLRWGGLE